VLLRPFDAVTKKPKRIDREVLLPMGRKREPPEPETNELHELESTHTDVEVSTPEPVSEHCRF
jgi:hypothetical protein